MENAAETIMFPGQGIEPAPMRSFAESYCPDLLELVCDLVGDDPFELFDEGTRYQQPALYCSSVGRWRAAGSPRSRFMVGHSLGEITAATCAGAFSEQDGARLAVARGRAMQRAAQSNPGGMLATLGAEAEVTRLAMSLGLTIAGENAPDQLVLAGPRPMIDEARAQLELRGIASVMLRGKGAFNSPAMVSAISEFRAAITDVEMRQPEGSLFSSVNARLMTNIKEELIAGLIRPVRWRQTLEVISLLGAERFLEIGPGDLLAQLARSVLGDDAEVRPVLAERFANA